MGVDDAAMLLETTWETDATTVGGLVTEALGHIPAGPRRSSSATSSSRSSGSADRTRSRSRVRRVVPVTSEDAR